MPRRIPGELASAYLIDRAKGFRLADFDPADTQGLDLKDRADELLKQGIERLSEMQQKLYAQDRWALLLIFQAMDAAGKDSVIRHVMSGVNPQGCDVHSFKTPSQEELNHDFLWRSTCRLPWRGSIGIFNRSYYEEVLVVRVHPDSLAKEQLPPSLVTKKLWKERFDDINAFERYLSRNGIRICKFFLHVSKEEQRKRFLSRLDEPDKNWKFSENDVRERKYWNAYMEAYEDVIRHTASRHAPWYVVPADNKWFTRLVVASVVIETLESLKLGYPPINSQRRRDIDSARKLLLRKGS
ncbi:MAG: polyphosphate kinase 2 family protein [Acidobacteriales bacterium]|nr:polyphosphate kinase 2 family protein [Terriglobales bacterium]